MRASQQISRGVGVRPRTSQKAAVFLASDDSAFITGIGMFVDGGTASI
jgi:enoyl-[acyl-carrier-protein] reductase (NADH)